MLCDRYLASGLVVQRTDGLDLAFLAAINQRTDPPDLIADAAFFYVSMSSTQIIEALAKQGLDAEWLQPLDENTDRNQPLLQIDKLVSRRNRVRNVRRMTMNFSELNRLLLELVDLEVWAEHTAILMQRTDLDGVPPWPYFVNEWEVWA